MKAADIKFRRDHNDLMTLAFWSSNWANLKKPPTLKQMLVPTESKPPRVRRDWQALKALLQIALPETR